MQIKETSLTKDQRQYNVERMDFSVNGAGTIGCPYTCGKF